MKGPSREEPECTGKGASRLVSSERLMRGARGPRLGNQMRAASSSFDVARMARELAAHIGSRMRKAYQPHWEQIVLRLNRTGEGSTDLVIVRGKRIYLSQRDRPMPMQPSPFAMVLRKHLANARLIGVEQHGFDRILTLLLDTKEGERRLVIELFRDGNVILLDEGGVIIQPLTHATYASRTLKRGEPYGWPPEQVDPRSLDAGTLGDILDASDADLARTLASRVNLGGATAHAVCAAADLDATAAAIDLSDDERTTLFTALSGMLDELRNGSGAHGWFEDSDARERWLSGSGVESGGLTLALEEVGPVAFATMDNNLRVDFDSLSHAIDTWWGEHDAEALARREMERLEEAGDTVEATGDRLGRREEQQEQAIERFAAKAERAQAVATAIQENWTHVDELLDQVKSAIESEGWDAVRSKAKGIEWIESIDAAERTMNAFLPGDDGTPDQRVTLHIDETVHQNAQRHFQAARTQKDKSKGAEAALDRTRGERKRDEKRAAKAEAAGRVRAVKRSKRFWFERHRWALLSGGHLIVGGRDAKGNDAVVRKHLDRNDVYVHADLHGAASCSLKAREGMLLEGDTSEGEKEGVPDLRIVQDLGGTKDSGEGESGAEGGPNEQVLAEAAQMAVAWSRAWAGGGAAATAFHARPSQVSKQTESGESLGRGAFVVRGQRTWHRDLPLEFAIGLATVNGVPLPITGPIASISAICSRWARITPGRTRKETVANRIAKATGLVQDDVLSALPAGQCEIAEDHGLMKY